MLNLFQHRSILSKVGILQGRKKPEKCKNPDGLCLQKHSLYRHAELVSASQYLKKSPILTGRISPKNVKNPDGPR
jgi:hypothetical protein